MAIRTFTRFIIHVSGINITDTIFNCDFSGTILLRFFVISSDLSHFHAYHEANYIDKRTADAIMALKPEQISYEQACGRIPVNGLLKLAKKHHLTPTLLDLRNSGDTAGDHNRVVGYGAFGFE